jgi:capsular polysaccharide biosynthesis protein
VREQAYAPLRGLGDWIATRSSGDQRLVAAIRASDDDVYTTRLVDIREPALVEPRRGYVFLRRGLYRSSFNWSALDDGPDARALLQYGSWVASRRRVRFLPTAVSLRTRWEENYWHCHDEVLSKLLLLDRLDVPGDTPLLVGARLWDAEFFREMREEAGLRDRNWVVHDRPVWSERLLLPLQGPIQLENAVFSRDLFRAGGAETGRTSGGTPPLLYVSRPGDAIRHIENHDELYHELSPMGFEAVQPERLSFREQIEWFRAARCVVLPHGAALANLMYRVGRPTGLVELFPADPDYLRRVYGPWLSRAAGFAYRAVVGSALSRRRGFTVDPNQVAAAAAAVLREVDQTSGGA